MEITIGIGNTKKRLVPDNSLRRRIVKDNRGKVEEFLQKQGLPVTGDLEKDCMAVTKQYEIIRKRFDENKAKGMTDANFRNFERSDKHEEMLEREFDAIEAETGFSGWETDFQDFKNFRESATGEFLNFSLKNIVKKVTQPIQQVATKVANSKVVQAATDAAKIAALPAAGIVGVDLGLKTGLGNTVQGLVTQVGSKVLPAGLTNAVSGLGKSAPTSDALTTPVVGSDLGGQPSVVVATEGGGAMQVPASQAVIYSDAPLSTVRSNVVATGAEAWLNEDRARAIDSIVKKDKEDRERSKIKAQLIEIGVSPERFKSFNGEDFDVNKAKDVLSDILGEVKQGEVAKGQMAAMPKILLFVGIAFVAGILFKKYL